MTNNNKDKRVVITGLGIVSPIGNDIKTFTNSLLNKTSGIKYNIDLDQYNFSCKIAGVPDISDKIYRDILETYMLTESDLAIKYAVIAGLSAWKDAGLDIPDYLEGKPQKDYGAIIGTCSGGYEIFARKVIEMVNNGKVKRLGSQIIENIMPSGPTAALSNILALSNIAFTNSAACSTGTESISLAYQRIKNGDANLLLTGSTDPYSPHVWAGFDSMRLLSRTHNDAPEKGSRPLSASSGGFVPGAGAGILILEELEHAINRKAKIYGEIASSIVNSGGQRNGGSMTASNPTMVRKCISDAIYDANIKGDDIDLICGHLTGTKSDPLEVANWKNGLNLNNNFPFINSLKSYTGHLIGAAGSVEMIAATLQLKNRFIHASLNCEDLHPEIESIYPHDKIPQETILNKELKYIAKASFGFGDVNSCIILKKYEN